MSTREIITIQLGHYSNFVGAHWWNIQETNFSYDPNNPSEINHDVLYREGETSQKQLTFTPRSLIVDLKGSLGYLNERGTLYNSDQDEETPHLLWDNENIEIKTENPIPKPTFVQNLDESTEELKPQSIDLDQSINSWVDYLVSRFHPRTINTVKEYRHNCTNHPFDIYTYGTNLWKTEQFSEDFTDRIRAYVEECDSMQGFQVLVDSADGFGGLGASCMQYLRDEYGKSILCFPCISGQSTEPSASDLVRMVNIALCWQNIGEYCSLFSPLCCDEIGWPRFNTPRKFDHLIYDYKLKYHTSSILATALDTLSLRYRRREYPNVVLSDLCADLNMLGRKAAATSLSLPFPMTAKKYLIDVLDEYEGPLWTSLTPSCNIPTDKNMQSIALRGIPEERLKRPMQDAMKQVSKPAYKCSSVHEMMTFYLACVCHASATYLTNIKSKLKIKQPYPKIFNNNITEGGDIAGLPTGADVQMVPVMAGLHSGSSLGEMYQSLYNETKKIRSIKRFHAFTDSGLEEDEFKDCLHHLLDCKEAYEDHYV